MIARILSLVILLAPGAARADVNRERVRAIERSIVTLRCPVSLLGPISMGFPIGDARTVIGSAQLARCRRDVIAVLPSGEEVRVIEARRAGGVPFALFTLERALEIEPLALEASDRDTLFAFAFVTELGGGLRRKRLDRDWLFGALGSPAFDRDGRVVGVVEDGAAPRAWDARDLAPLFEDAEPPLPTRRRFSAGIAFEGGLFYEPARDDAPSLTGVGFGVAAELAIDDAILLSSWTRWYFINTSANDGYEGWRLENDLRAGYRLAPAEWLALTIEGGIAVAYERRPEWSIGEDSTAIWVRPQVALTARFFWGTISYSFSLDPSAPASSTHHVGFGFSIDTP
jgi:hypothetical protein